MSNENAIDLKTQMLVAALDCTEGDLEETFTSEELLVKAWRRWPQSWGLRGFEDEYPDSHRVHRELDSRGKASKGVVALGMVERVQPRVYRLTPKGLAMASEALPKEAVVRERATRELESEIEAILQHPVFREWLIDPCKPERFRDAGRFWRIAPGTPARVIQERIARVGYTLDAAAKFLDAGSKEEIVDRYGRRLFDKTDIDRCRGFQAALLTRFERDLTILGVDLG